ncbi:MAG: ABC transporter ATP-binding protein [Prevotella sp.]|nr:ABC transporter ATP-binding protein [Prevotella sp.]
MNYKLFHTPDFKYNARTIMRWLWRAWRGNRVQAVINAGLGLVEVAISLSQVWAVKRAIDIAAGATEGNIYWAVALMGLLILASFAVRIASIWVKNILGIRAQNRMQQRLLDRILRSEWHGKELRHSGDVINRLGRDVEHVVTFLTETLPSTLSTLAMFVGAFCYLASMDWRLAIVITAMIPVFLAFSKIYMGRMRLLTRKVRDSNSKVQSLLQETVQNRMLIKTLEGDSEMVGRLEETQSELRQNVVRRTQFSVFSNFILNFGFSLGYLVAFLWAALRMSASTLTFGGMTAFLQLVNRVQGPARNLSQLIPAFVTVFTSAERLMELEENPLEEQGKPLRVKSPCGLRLSNVSFAYPDEPDDQVISNLSFDFRPGTCTAVVGETGAGKTTLIRLLLALMQPTEGSIDIYSLTPDIPHPSSLVPHPLTPLHRCNFVYVPQGNTLMSGTIRDNLRLGKLNASDEEMMAALHASCADFVEELPAGLDTICGEQGGGLSEGQCQRIAIARALLRNRNIMIFDEATSALDPETERQLLQNILATRKKTIIFITHRLAVLDYCDQTLRMEKT